MRSVWKYKGLLSVLTLLPGGHLHIYFITRHLRATFRCKQLALSFPESLQSV